jgi:hypothetical protein
MLTCTAFSRTPNESKRWRLLGMGYSFLGGINLNSIGAGGRSTMLMASWDKLVMLHHVARLSGPAAMSCSPPNHCNDQVCIDAPFAH